MFKRFMVLGVLSLALLGCGSIKKHWTEFAPDRDADYLDAQSAPALTMPSGLAMNKTYLSDPYPLPKGLLPAQDAKPVDIFPPTLKREASDDDDDDTDAS